MESSDFRENRLDTAWLDRRIAHNVRAAKPEPVLVAVVGAVCKAYKTCEQRAKDYMVGDQRGGGVRGRGRRYGTGCDHGRGRAC